MSTTTTTPAPAPPRGWVSTGRKAPSVADVSRATVLTAMALVVLIPILWTFLSSFKTTSELAQRPPSLLPGSLSLNNYTEALSSFNFAVYLRNSVIVVVGATILTLIINSMAAYALAKYNFRGRNALFLLTLATIMIPLQVILIPVYLVTSQLGLVNTLWGLIIPAAATPTGVFVLRQYMLTIPDELIEAARIDGAGEFRVFLSVVLPTCRPALAVVAIFSVVWRWNDFLWPLIIAQNENVYTLPVAVARFAGQQVVPFNLILAMSVVSMLPVIIVFLFTQRHVTQGIATTGLK
jgi:alpha-1,4-digalacturonate transport system permease protein